MQPRIESPAVTVPGALEALQTLAAVTSRAGLPETAIFLAVLRVSQINRIF